MFPTAPFLSVWLESPNAALVGIALLGTLVGLYLFSRGFQLLRFKRMILDTPLSHIHSASIGLVEVTGTPVGPYTLTAPVTGDPCYYYRVQAWQWVVSDNKGAWKSVLDESLFVPFFLEDSTGRVLVNPQGAEMDVHRNFADEVGSMIFSTPGVCPPHVRDFLARRGLIPTEKIKIDERVIPPGFPLFVFGTLGENVIPNSWNAQVHLRSSSALSASIFRSPLLRFTMRPNLVGSATSAAAVLLDHAPGFQISVPDAIRIGTIKLSTNKSTLGDFDLHPSAAIGKGERNEPFAISWHSQKEVAGKLAWKSAACIWGGPLLAILCLYFLMNCLQWIS